MKFSLSNKGLSPLNKIIKIGYKNSDKNYRKLVGEAYHNAIVGEYPNFTMDYSMIKVSDGKVFFEIPTAWEYKDLNFRVFMSSNDLQENSDSRFVR